MTQEQFMGAWSQVNTFCQEYWWAGPIILAAVTIGGGLVNRASRQKIAQKSQEELDRVKNDLMSRINNLESANRKRDQDAVAEDPNRPMSAAERMCKLLRTALGFPLTDWKLTTENEPTSAPAIPGLTTVMTCTKGGFDKVNYKINSKGLVTIFVGKEEVTKTAENEQLPYGGNKEKISTLCTNVKNFKVAALEEARLSALADGLDGTPPKTEPVVVLPPTVTNTMTGTITPTDTISGASIYAELMRVLAMPGRFKGPIQQDINQMGDSLTIVFRSNGPDDADVFVSGVTVMPLFNTTQRQAVARKCYELVSQNAERGSYLSNILAGLKKIA